MTGRLCATCEGPLPDANPRRKFCSGRCRKAQYGTPCIDCGAMTSGSEGRRPNSRCVPCGVAHTSALATERSRELRDRIIALWAAGKTLREIAEELGWKYAATKAFVMKMRAEGEPIPYRSKWTPRNLERQSERARAMKERRWRAAA